VAGLLEEIGLGADRLMLFHLPGSARQDLEGTVPISAQGTVPISAAVCGNGDCPSRWARARGHEPGRKRGGQSPFPYCRKRGQSPGRKRGQSPFHEKDPECIAALGAQSSRVDEAARKGGMAPSSVGGTTVSHVLHGAGPARR
jgi:hypothetical protein